jgi:arsenite-transporting ATPase
VLLTVKHLLDRRVLFFGGKGGVGKTTCSTALALAASRAGRRVLLVSTDPAHSTSDILERPLGPDEREVLPNLWGQEIDEEAEARRYLDEAKQRLAGLFKPGVLREASRQIELAGSMPGATDVAVFERMATIVLARRDAFDLVVFDTAPTGHALRLLRMPELMAAWVQALAARRRDALAAASPATAPDPVLAALAARADRLRRFHAALTREGECAFVLVLVPERLPIEESARALHLLEDLGVPLGGVVVNRVLPDRTGDPFLLARKAQERVYLDEIERRVSAAPRVLVPQLARDVHGLDSLEEVGRHLLGTRL